MKARVLCEGCTKKSKRHADKSPTAPFPEKLHPDLKGTDHTHKGNFSADVADGLKVTNENCLDPTVRIGSKDKLSTVSSVGLCKGETSITTFASIEPVGKTYKSLEHNDH